MIWTIISSLLCLIPSTFLLVFLIKLSNWIYLTVVPSKDFDLSAYGGSKVVEGPMRSPKVWALITGASDGIGAAFAKEIAKKRLNLFLVGRNIEKLNGVKTEIESLRKKALLNLCFISVELGVKVVCLISEASDTDQDNIESLFSQIEDTLKPGHTIRILINNVGIGQNGKRRLGDIVDDGIFEEIVKVNCIYPVLLTRAFLKRLKANPEDDSRDSRYAILNLASCAALTPATPFSSLYAATKSFNRSFSLSLSGEMGAKNLLHPETTPPVDVICVNSGFVVSNMTKMNESPYCCTSSDHAKIVFYKMSRSNGVLGAVDLIPHWKHGLMWSILAVLEVLIPSEWFLVAVVMPTVLKFSGKFRKFEIKDE